MFKRWFYHWTRHQRQCLGDQEDFLLVTWDSCRYDTYAQAATPVLDRFGLARKAWAMATYTLPAHLAMYYGFLPQTQTAEPLYNRFHQQLWRICHRNVLTKPLVTFPLGTASIVAGFAERGYFTFGAAAMDWFRDAPPLRQGFDEMHFTGTAAARQNELFVQRVKKRAKVRPFFALLNYGETHSPFHYEGMPPRPSGVDAEFNNRRLFNQRSAPRSDWRFDEANFAQQRACAEYLDSQMASVLDFLTERGRPTTVVVCADHGECFGEDGFYGHGIYHPKVMEVFLLIFRLNAPPHHAEANNNEPRQAA